MLKQPVTKEIQLKQIFLQCLTILMLVIALAIAQSSFALESVDADDEISAEEVKNQAELEEELKKTGYSKGSREFDFFNTWGHQTYRRNFGLTEKQWNRYNNGAVYDTFHGKIDRGIIVHNVRVGNQKRDLMWLKMADKNELLYFGHKDLNGKHMYPIIGVKNGSPNGLKYFWLRNRLHLPDAKQINANEIHNILQIFQKKSQEAYLKKTVTPRKAIPTLSPAERQQRQNSSQQMSNSKQILMLPAPEPKPASEETPNNIGKTWESLGRGELKQKPAPKPSQRNLQEDRSRIAAEQRQQRSVTSTAPGMRKGSTATRSKGWYKKQHRYEIGSDGENLVAEND